MKKSTIKLKFRAEVKWDREAKVFVSYAPVLGIYSQGSNVKRAIRNLEDAVRGAVLVAFKPKKKLDFRS